MKNKTIQRILSFTLALILCFSIAVKPIEAKALAVESWLIYAIITYMAAVGFTFTAAGGANALMSAVEDRWGEFQEHKKGEGIIIDIAPYIQYKPPTPSPGGNGFDIGPKFWYGVAAAAAIKDFIEWLKSDQLWDGNVSELTSGYYVPIEYGTITVDNVIQSIKLITDSNGQPYKRTTGSGWTSLNPEYSCGTLVPYPNGFSFNYGGADVHSHASEFYYSDDGFCKLRSNDGSTTSFSIDNLLSQLNNCTIDEFAGVTFFLNEGTSYSKTQNRVGLAFVKTNGWIYLTNSWVVLETSTGNVSSFYEYKEQGFTITIPQTIPEFDVEENQLVEISFDAFPDNVSYETPEEFAEAIEQTIADTGTIPSIKSDVILDPDSVPDVEPSAPPSGEVTPNPETPEEPDLSEYPDIEGLGLPALGDALFKKFPFCIPNDLKTFFGVLTAEPETPYWEVDLTGDALGIESKFVIDLTEYEVVGRMSRWGSVITFCLFLIMNTKRFIGW